MTKLNNPMNTLKTLDSQGRIYYSLPALVDEGYAAVRRLPVSLRILLEALLRNCDGKLATEKDVQKLATWSASAGAASQELPFVVSRVLLQDFTGVPLLVDLAAMRDVAAEQGADPTLIEPRVPVDLIIDHSVQVDRAGTADAYTFNLEIETRRNQERYAFLKWGQNAFKTLRIVPPGVGICHQVNLEYLATVVSSKTVNEHELLFPDTVVGTDSHTTMVNGLGVLGWGVGGIEAEAAMLGQPIALLIPDVIGVYLHGDLKEGVTATDLTLRITEMLRKENVVGKFVEFFGPGVAALSVADRATIANMAPEYGATMGFFPVDERTLEYLLLTGRSREQVDLVRAYLTEQELFGLKERGEIDFTKELTLNLNSVSPSVAGPKRPQDRIDLPKLKEKFIEQLRLPVDKGGYGKAEELDKKPPKICVHTGGAFNLNYEHETGGMSALDPDKEDLSWSEEEMVTNRPLTEAIAHPGYLEGTTCDIVLRHGSVAIAAITSCTNTSNPHVMLAAGLVAKKAVEAGLKVNPMVKTSLAPGSRVVTDYLQKSGLQHYLDELGFNLVAYGCTTCIGNSGPLEERIEMAVKDHDLVVASVLSGNRNFEARVNSAVKANFLMSPPLVVAFALAGCVDIDLEKEPLGYGSDGKGVFLKDIWPTNAEIEETLKSCLKPEMFIERYSKVFEGTSHWENIPTVESAQYAWDPDSTYIQKPPYFDGFTPSPHFSGHFSQMRPLALFGDSVTTDHISPAGAFRSATSAGKYLISLGVNEGDFNSYGSRRGNHQVMMRGTFANVRIRNFMAEGKEGGYTKLLPSGEIVSIFDACEHYMEEKVPLIVFAGKDYGMGSSRDWAAKGPALLGVVAVVASSFERIHRSNLIGMGVLPLEFAEGVTHESLGIRGDELFTLKGIELGLRPGQEVVLEISRGNKVQTTPLNVRLDTPAEVDYFLNGGILPYVVRQLLKQH